MNVYEAALRDAAPEVFGDPSPAPRGVSPWLPSSTDTVDRARAYIAEMGPAIEGQGGDHHTFRAACVLVRDFGLADADAMMLLSEWNLTCVPPWTEVELEAKIRSANKSGSHAIGAKLSSAPPGWTGGPVEDVPPPGDGDAEPAAGGIPDAVPRLRAFTSAELQRHTFNYRRPLLYRGDTPILREGHLGELYAVRGIGKTWVAHTLAYVAANAGCEALGFRSEESARVLIVDGEMSSTELQERAQTIEGFLGVPPTSNLTVVAADWQDNFLPRLDTTAGRVAIEPYIDAADLIILDNRSALFDPEAEKDPSAWQPAQDWLLSLRRRRKAVLVVHHSNRQGGARGHSKPEDVMDLLVKLTRPEGYSAEQGARFTLEFDKTRGIHGAALVPFTARLHPDGWHLEDALEERTAMSKLREYLHLAHHAGDRPKSANAAITKARIGRNAGLTAWAALKQAGDLREHIDGGFYVA